MAGGQGWWPGDGRCYLCPAGWSEAAWRYTTDCDGWEQEITWPIQLFSWHSKDSPLQLWPLCGPKLGRIMVPSAQGLQFLNKAANAQ